MANVEDWLLNNQMNFSPVREEIFQFTYQSDPSMFLKTLAANAFITDVELEILIPFNSPSTTISVGTFPEPNKVIGTQSIDPTVAAIYCTRGNKKFIVTEPIRLFLNLAGATQGSGQLILRTKGT